MLAWLLCSVGSAWAYLRCMQSLLYPLNLGPVNPLGVLKRVLRSPQTNIQSRKPDSFYLPIRGIFQLFSLTASQLYSGHVDVESWLILFICFWWRQWVAGRSLKFASCRGGWGVHAKKRPNLISQQSKKRWWNEGSAAVLGTVKGWKGSAATISWRTIDLNISLPRNRSVCVDCWHVLNALFHLSLNSQQISCAAIHRRHMKRWAKCRERWDNLPTLYLKCWVCKVPAKTKHRQKPGSSDHEKANHLERYGTQIYFGFDGFTFPCCRSSIPNDLRALSIPCVYFLQ